MLSRRALCPDEAQPELFLLLPRLPRPDSVTLSGYDDAENHQLLLTVYSDGVCILNNAFVSVKYPGGGAAELYQALAEIVE